ncbi:hypothetical protein [Rhizobium leguminosarum]|uniref:hypothetical protein n=1 Tax=Rhizobium leguminosarum TaxID=384 RepID=UPI003F951800
MLQKVIRTGKPVARVDVPAVAGQFLADLSLADLVVELVQNDLDAGATKTSVTFGETSLIAEGDGGFVDEGGWKRLSYVLGAGGEVQAKAGGIGSKNHGLRAMYLLSDEFSVQSGGYRVDLTACGNEDRPRDFYPATWDRIDDPDCPKKGTRITAPYRTGRLRKPDGDGSYLEAPSSEMLDELWSTSVTEAPERFVTASEPGKAWRYELVFARHGSDTQTFVYECKPLKDEIYLRTCKRQIGDGPAETIVRRHCFRFPIEDDDLGGGKVAKLFVGPKATYGEISWLIDKSNLPAPSTGILRYPIAFPQETAFSGVGFDISAPFIAMRARHDVTEDPRNARIVDAAYPAFASIAGKRLVKRYGPRLGVLATSIRYDADRSDRLIELMLSERAFSVCASWSARSVTAVPMRRSSRLVVACSRARLGLVDRTLSRLASGRANILHPQTPSDLVERLLASCRDEVEVFDELSAVAEAFVEDVPERATDRRLSLCAAALEAVDRLRKQTGAIPADVVAALKERGHLPVSDRTTHPWGKVKRSQGGVPSVPGITEPLIVHPSLAKLPILDNAKLRLPKFDLDVHLKKRDFSNVRSSGRQVFFDWLAANIRNVKRERLSEIATYPIWPGEDGVHRALEDYCHPKDRHIATIMKGICLPAARSVAALASKKASRGRLKLRKQPTSDEFESWYTRTVEAIDKLAVDANSASVKAAVDSMEEDLERLSSRGVPVEDFASDYRTIAQDGVLRAVSTLHTATNLVNACALPGEYLCRARRTALYGRLGAFEKPLAPALLEALRRDPDRSRLFIRLEHYKRAGRDLAELNDEPIIPLRGQLFRPRELAFRAEPDLWGEWKVKLDKYTNVPAEHALLVALGVMSNSLKNDQSASFFEWLSQQSRKIQRDHLPQVLRHWKDLTHGPVLWAKGAIDIPCIPTVGAEQKFDMVSLREATSLRGRVFLDDFRHLRDAALASGNVRLALDTDGRVISVVSGYVAAGLKSLKSAAGAPVAISISGESQPPDYLLRDLAVLKAPRLASTLKSKLPKSSVPSADIRGDIRNLVKNLAAIRFGQGLSAIYIVAGARLAIDVPSAVDVTTGEIHVSSASDPTMSFYNALAEYLFRAGSNPHNAWGLMTVVKDDASADQLLFGDVGDEEDGPEQDDEPAQESGETSIRSAHGTGDQAPLTPQAPNPQLLKPITKATYPQSRPGRSKMRRPSATDTKRNSMEEQEHIRALKEDHYAWHCQACLGIYDVLKIAPPDTYVYSPGYRRGLIEAHHVQHLQNAGGLGASNLIILCSYHHRLIGDELSREMVLEALSTAGKIVRRFPVDLSGLQTVRREGALCVIQLSKEPLAIRLFFTKEHAKIWSAASTDPA